jgi:hypothetical protein
VIFGFAPDQPTKSEIGENFGPVRVVCVVRDYEAPTACLGVERSRSGRVRAAVPVSTRDPRVTSVPVFRLPEMGPAPHCGNCV